MSNDDSLRARYEIAKNECARLRAELQTAVDLVAALENELACFEPEADERLRLSAESWRVQMFKRFLRSEPSENRPYQGPIPPVNESVNHRARVT
jgi:hypothetical protein